MSKQVNVKYFIRIGDIPVSGRSSIYNGETKVGEEKGVSVFDAHMIDNKWRIVLPAMLKMSLINTLVVLCNEVNQENWEVENPRKIYLVCGEEVGHGTEGEPILTDVEVVEDITKTFLI